MFSDFATSHGVQVVSGSEDNTIHVWDLQSQSTVQVLKGHACVPISVSCHPKSAILATSTLEPENAIVLWGDDSVPLPDIATEAPAAFSTAGHASNSGSAAGTATSAAPAAASPAAAPASDPPLESAAAPASDPPLESAAAQVAPAPVSAPTVEGDSSTQQGAQQPGHTASAAAAPTAVPAADEVSTAAQPMAGSTGAGAGTSASSGPPAQGGTKRPREDDADEGGSEGGAPKAAKQE